MRTGAAVARASTAAARRATRARSGRPDAAQDALWLLRPVERRERERAALAAEDARQGARIDYVRKRARPDSRQADLWPVHAADRRAAEAEAKRQIARWLNYQTMSGPASGRARPLAEIDADIDAVAARCVGRVTHLDAAAAYRAGRSLYRRHRRRVESGAWARAFGNLQAMRARRRTRARLEECERRDRRIGRLRKAGRSWRDVAGRVGCSHETCRGAAVRLRRLSAIRLRRRVARRAERRAAERALACVNRAIRYRSSRSGDPGSVVSTSGVARLPRARVKDGECSTFGALRRAGYWTWCNFEPGLPDDERVEIVKRMAAKGGIAYDGSSVGAAVDAAGFLWERNGRPGAHVGPALGVQSEPEPDEPCRPARRLDRTASGAPLGNLARRKAAMQTPAQRAAFDAFMALRGPLARPGVGTPAGNGPRRGANAGVELTSNTETGRAVTEASAGPAVQPDGAPAGRPGADGAAFGRFDGARRPLRGSARQSGRRC